MIDSETPIYNARKTKLIRRASDQKIRLAEKLATDFIACTNPNILATGISTNSEHIDK